MQLTKNFTLSELAVTNTGYLNEPRDIESAKLLCLATYILQPIRDTWGALQISSGYRSPQVNSAVGGSQTSQHVYGEAADIIPSVDIDLVFAWIVKESGIKFGQCIRESKGGSEWIHVSLPRIGKPNQQALVYDGQSYRPYVGVL